MSGFPDAYSVPTRNRHYSNQPGGLAKPEQVMVTEFTPSSPQADHMRSQADAMRATEPLESGMDYAESNQPGEDE
jgi:hypothetical protein